MPVTSRIARERERQAGNYTSLTISSSHPEETVSLLLKPPSIQCFSLPPVFLSRMRAISAVIFMAVCVLVVLAFQGIRQELNLRELQGRIKRATEQVKKKEDEIVESKQKIQELNNQIAPMNTKKDQLTKQKDELQKSTDNAQKDLEKCNKEKADSEKKKTDAVAALPKLKADQEEEKKKAEEEIQALKQQILDRDKKICEFVDPNQTEGMKLCGK